MIFDIDNLLKFIGSLVVTIIIVAIPVLTGIAWCKFWNSGVCEGFWGFVQIFGTILVLIYVAIGTAIIYYHE